jgi:hypothetical protein
VDAIKWALPKLLKKLVYRGEEEEEQEQELIEM